MTLPTPVLYTRNRDRRVMPSPGPSPPPPNLARHVIDSSQIISDRSRGFVGRGFVFRAIDSFVNDNSSGYFLLTGEPGIGKTSMVAEMVRRHKNCHHFIIRGQRATNRTEAFLPNICAQLILENRLQHQTLPADACRSSAFLLSILAEISDQLGADEHVLLLLDALDEVDNSELRHRGNNLFDLPPSLPDKIFMMLTAQGDRYRKVPLRLQSLRQVFEIPAKHPENLDDAAAYVRTFLDHQGIRDYLVGQRISDERFVSDLVERSQGNFMYLHYVLPAIEKGPYNRENLDQLPVGLENYYEDLWQRMKERGEQDWFEYKLPVLAALTVVPKPVSVGFIDRILGGKGRSRIAAVLTEWQPFLHRLPVRTARGTVSRFALYHGSFHEFISKKDVVAEEKVGLREMALTIAHRSGESKKGRVSE